MSGPWAALDPGSQKCGLVRTDVSGLGLSDLLICSPREAWDWLQHWQQQAPLQGVVLGDGTASGPWQEAMAQLQPAVPFLLQPEAGSTLAARDRYWEFLPARGWQKFLPRGLRLPPRPVDDLAALVLLEAYLGRRFKTLPAP
jgi:hypothetical protein